MFLSAQVDAISGQVVTGNELRTRSIRFARALLNIGITLGDCIFICSEDRMEFAYALLGAIYIGASVAFVEPNYAECICARLNYKAIKRRLKLINLYSVSFSQHKSAIPFTIPIQR